MNKIFPVLLREGRTLIAETSSLLCVSSKISNCALIQIRGVGKPRPLRIKYPFWYLQKERANYQENISRPNREFIQEIVRDDFGEPDVIGGVQTYNVKTPLQSEPFERGQWNIKSQRTGLIGRKIGVYPLWTKDGKKISSTLIQFVDNHVIKYIPPEDFDPPRKPYDCIGHKKNLGCLLVGAESTDPQKFTKEYCGLFFKQGLMPKKVLGRFLITPEAKIQPGTPLFAAHFKVGDYVDVRGQTIQRGFQGVMKRWGFHGQPATHGQTKTHRRPGTIGQGRDKRVKPGKKLPGHMGYKHRTQRGLQILRMDTEYNVIWVKGQAIPGDTNSIVYVYDTNVTHKLLNHKNQPIFPTFYPEDLKEPLPKDIVLPEIFDFSKPTITYEIPPDPKKKRK